MSKKNQQTGLTTEELQQLLVATIDLPFIRETRAKTDYMLDVLETVLNFHIQEPVVIAALAYFQKHHNPPPVHQWQPSCIHTHADLQNALNGFADTPEGNQEASQYLWGNRHWTRIGLLRRFMEFLTSINITDQSSLPPRVTIVVASLEPRTLGAAMKEISGTLRTIIQGPGSSSAVAA
jgi:hypothetical protein